MNFIAIDFETTAYAAAATNEPWQWGLAVVRNSCIVEAREFFFDVEGAPPRAHEPDALGTLLSSYEQWAPLIEGMPLAAHNAATERTILVRTAPFTKWGPWIDTLKLAKARYPNLPNYTLSGLCEMFDLVPDIPGRSWHDGLYDAVACANLAIWLKTLNKPGEPCAIS